MSDDYSGVRTRPTIWNNIFHKLHMSGALMRSRQGLSSSLISSAGPFSDALLPAH